MSPRRKRAAIVAIGLLVLLAVDLARRPESQLTARLLLGGIDLYQATLSPLMLRTGVRCRFQPTCSHYGEMAIRKHGALKGSGMAAWRIVRCGPWTPAGTVDYP
ncbi:MAG TPA: membrane protein insertion efficiency factor YidD [Thermoanaerobaculia bacterium]